MERSFILIFCENTYKEIPFQSLYKLLVCLSGRKESKYFESFIFQPQTAKGSSKYMNYVNNKCPENVTATAICGVAPALILQVESATKLSYTTHLWLFYLSYFKIFSRIVGVFTNN